MTDRSINYEQNPFIDLAKKLSTRCQHDLYCQSLFENDSDEITAFANYCVFKYIYDGYTAEDGQFRHSDDTRSINKYVSDTNPSDPSYTLRKTYNDVSKLLELRNERISREISPNNPHITDFSLNSTTDRRTGYQISDFQYMQTDGLFTKNLPYQLLDEKNHTVPKVYAKYDEYVQEKLLELSKVRPKRKDDSKCEDGSKYKAVLSHLDLFALESALMFETYYFIADLAEEFCSKDSSIDETIFTAETELLARLLLHPRNHELLKLFDLNSTSTDPKSLIDLMTLIQSGNFFSKITPHFQCRDLLWRREFLSRLNISEYDWLSRIDQVSEIINTAHSEVQKLTLTDSLIPVNQDTDGFALDFLETHYNIVSFFESNRKWTSRKKRIVKLLVQSCIIPKSEQKHKRKPSQT